MEEFEARQRCVVAGVPGLEELAVPEHRAFVEAAFGIEVQPFPIVALIRRIAQQPLDLDLRTTLVARAAADERLPDIVVEVDGLVLSASFGDMKNEKRLAVDLDQMFLHGDDAVQLPTGPQDTEEIVLNLVHLQNADNLEAARAVPDAEHEPTAFGIGKGRDCFVG